MWRRARVQVGPRAEAGIHEPPRRERVEGRPIGLFAVVLEEGALVPGEPQPFEVALHCVDVLPLGALRVQVLDAQHHASALRLRHQPGDQRREHVARMHASRRRRREPPDHFHVPPSLRRKPLELSRIAFCVWVLASKMTSSRFVVCVTSVRKKKSRFTASQTHTQNAIRDNKSIFCDAANRAAVSLSTCACDTPPRLAGSSSS